MVRQSQMSLRTGFEFLSGYPEAVRQKRKILLIQACFDESGVLGTDRIMAFGGFLANADYWSSFAARWSEELSAVPVLRSFKMNAAARLDDDFRLWSSPERNEKIARLVGVLTEPPPWLSMTCTIDIQAHKDAGFAKPFRDPYFLGCYHIIQAVCQEVLASGSQEDIEIIFDTHLIFAPRVNQWYDFIGRMWAAQKDTAALAAILPPSPVFRCDDKFVPLQAGDMLAWLARYEVSGKPHDFRWIIQAMQRTIPMSKASFHYGAAAIEQLKDVVAAARGIDVSDFPGD